MTNTLKTLKPYPTYGICRVDQEEKHNFGYIVRVGEHKVWISDRKNGGRRKARASALALRDKFFLKLPAAIKLRASRKHRNTKKTLP